MAIQAQMADGRMLEFPDGTNPAVIQSTVQRLIAADAPIRQPSLGSPMGDELGSAIMAEAQPKRESVLQGMDMPAPVTAPGVKPEFIDALQANLNAMPEAERTAKLQQLKQRPDVYGKAANVIEQRYQAQGLSASPALTKLTDLRLEPQTQRFMDQGMELQSAQNLAAQQAMMGRSRPDLQQVGVDVAGEQAKAEAERVAEELKNAGFMTRVGAEAKGQAAQTGLGLIGMYADLTGDKEMQGNVAGAARVQKEAGQAIPKGEGVFEKSAQQAIASAAVQAPMMVLGVVTGTAAPVLIQAGIQSLGSSYGEGRQAGLSPTMAMARAAPMAAAEVLFERFGMTKALGGLRQFVSQAEKNGVKLTGNDIATYFGKAIATEIPAEMQTTLAQYGIDVLPGVGLNKNPSVGDLYKQLEETLRQTVIQSGAMAGAGAGVIKGAQAISERLPESRQAYQQDKSIAGTAEKIAREKGFLAPEKQTIPGAPEARPVAPPVAEVATPVESVPVTGPSALAEQRAAEQQKVLDLEQKLESQAQEEAAPAAAETELPAVIKPEEDYANKSFEELQTLRENADQTNHAMDMAALEKHFGPEVAGAYENMNRSQRRKWWDENATAAMEQDSSTFNGVNEDLLDEYIKAYNDFDTESPRALGRSVGVSVRNMNDRGFVGSPEFVRLKNALAYAKQQGFSEAEVLGGMRERAIEWAGADAQELFKDLFKAKPAEANVPKLAPAEENIPLADEEFTPFATEDLSGEAMPERPEVQELLNKQAEANKAVEALSKRTAGTSLMKVLQGSLKDSEMSELGGRARQIGKNPFIALVAKKGKPGSSMEDMVDSGALDLFLPAKMRPDHPAYDNQESAAYIREKLMQGQYYTNETQMAIDNVTQGVWDLDQLIQQELSIDDINKEIQLAFDEQREADLAAEKAAPEGEAGAAEQRKAEATNEELDKREAQLEREDQLNKREAKLLEERKRLEEDRLKLESPTEADVVQQEEKKAQAAALDEQEQIRKESEAGAGQFELTREEGRQDTTGNLFDQPVVEPAVIAISSEQERKEAMENFALKLRFPILPFMARSAKKTQLLKPVDLTSAQIKEIVGLASDALDLGMPPLVLGNVTAAGSTRKDVVAVMSSSGWLMIAKKWKESSKAEKLQVLIHELAHAVDTAGGKPSEKASWAKAHAELQGWYTNSANKLQHPLAYPFAPQFKGRVRPKEESFAQAFAYYFVSPVDLQTNAPEAYSQIQSIVERIQDGSQEARATGTTKRSTAGIQIQPSRTVEGAAVQPEAGAERTGVSGATRLEDRGAAGVTNTPAFKRWFGNSKVVDDNGEPLVVYHGTPYGGFSEFSLDKSGTRNTFESARAGIYFSSTPRYAGAMARSGDETGPAIYPVYLSIKNPLRVFTTELTDADEVDAMIADAKNGGHDGIIDEMGNFVAFRPEQIKSATGNIGAFDPESVDINEAVGLNIMGRRPLVNWTAPEFTDKDKFIYWMQNRQIDTKRVVDEITKAVGKIDDTWNPYLNEELFHGRAAKQTKDFLVNELRPLLKEMDKLNVSMPELEEYLHNTHAEERNVQNAAHNPNMQDGGSGIDTADARAYLAALTPEQKANYARLASMVKIITGNTRRILVDSGLERQDTINTWEKTYGNYVPLNRNDVDYSSNQGMSVGQGYSVKGTSTKRSIGSKRKVVDILANIAMQRERTIVRAEKNRVATALYGLALQNANPDFWLAVNPDSKKDLPGVINELINMGLSIYDARNLMKEPTQTGIDPKTGLVVERVNPILRGASNVMAVRVNGKDRFVFFNQNNEGASRMVTALKNLDADQLGFIMSNMAKATRFFASINTQYNPVFGVYNFLRDMEGATLQLSTTELAGKNAEVMKKVAPALRGIYSQLRADHKGVASSNPWSKLWEEFQEEGGQTGFRDQFSRSEERGQALERELKKMSQGKASDFKDAVFNWLSDYNETMENAVRLAAYKAALDNGLSKAKAASLAKNLTVNFNRKGQVAVQANALYAFFNSAVQGTTRLGQTLTGPLGKTIIAGGLIAGSMQAVLLSAMGFGDDDPPDFIKDKNFIIPLMNGKYFAIPMPLGYNVIPSTARILTEGAIAKFEGKKLEVAKRIGHLTGLWLDSFNPVGNAGWSSQTFTPTLFDPVVALFENRDWTGKPIAREDFNKLDPTPGYLRAKETATIFGKKISEFINYASGGTKDVPGLVSPTPDQIDYLIGQVTGGLGREVMKAEQSLRSVVTGEELPPHKMPLIGRFYGDVKGSASVANHFYENIKKMNEYENTIKGMQQRKENVQELLKENPEARAYQMANEVERDVQKLRKRRREQIEKGAEKTAVKATEVMITKRMQKLNDKIAELEKKRQ